MDDDSLLSLKWNNHVSTLCSVLSNVREHGNYADCTLVAGGRFYQAHKLILSMCSEFMNDILKQAKCKFPVIVFKDIEAEDLEYLLDYMYLGNVNVCQKDLPLLLKAAEHLKIKGLAAPDIGSMTKKLEADNEKEASFKRKRSESPVNFQIQPKVIKIDKPQSQKPSSSNTVKIIKEESVPNKTPLNQMSSNPENENCGNESSTLAYVQSQIDVSYDENTDYQSEFGCTQPPGRRDKQLSHWNSV